MCRVNADVFPGSLNSNNDIVSDWRCETHSVGTQWHWQWQSVGEPHDAIFTVSDELSLESPINSLLNVLLQSLASIPQIYQSIFQTNWLEIASHLVKPPPKRKTVYSEPCHVLRGEKCPDVSRMFALKYRVRRDLNTDVTVFDWHTWLWLVTLASRCSKRTARKLPRCGTGGPRETYILWFVIVRASTILNLLARHISRWHVKDETYWPELARRSEKCAGPAGQCLCRGLSCTGEISYLCSSCTGDIIHLHSSCTGEIIYLHSSCTGEIIYLHSSCTSEIIYLGSSCTGEIIYLHSPCTGEIIYLHSSCTGEIIYLHSSYIGEIIYLHSPCTGEINWSAFLMYRWD